MRQARKERPIRTFGVCNIFQDEQPQQQQTEPTQQLQHTIQQQKQDLALKGIFDQKQSIQTNENQIHQQFQQEKQAFQVQNFQQTIFKQQSTISDPIQQEHIQSQQNFPGLNSQQTFQNLNNIEAVAIAQQKENENSNEDGWEVDGHEFYALSKKDIQNELNPFEKSPQQQERNNNEQQPSNDAYSKSYSELRSNQSQSTKQTKPQINIVQNDNKFDSSSLQQIQFYSDDVDNDFQSQNLNHLQQQHNDSNCGNIEDGYLNDNVPSDDAYDPFFEPTKDDQSQEQQVQQIQFQQEEELLQQYSNFDIRPSYFGIDQQHTVEDEQAPNQKSQNQLEETMKKRNSIEKNDADNVNLILQKNIPNITTPYEFLIDDTMNPDQQQMQTQIINKDQEYEPKTNLLISQNQKEGKINKENVQASVEAVTHAFFLKRLVPVFSFMHGLVCIENDQQPSKSNTLRINSNNNFHVFQQQANLLQGPLVFHSNNTTSNMKQMNTIMLLANQICNNQNNDQLKTSQFDNMHQLVWKCMRQILQSGKIDLLISSNFEFFQLISNTLEQFLNRNEKEIETKTGVKLGQFYQETIFIINSVLNTQEQRQHKSITAKPKQMDWGQIFFEKLFLSQQVNYQNNEEMAQLIQQYLIEKEFKAQYPISMLAMAKLHNDSKEHAICIEQTFSNYPELFLWMIFKIISNSASKNEVFPIIRQFTLNFNALLQDSVTFARPQHDMLKLIIQMLCNSDSQISLHLESYSAQSYRTTQLLESYIFLLRALIKNNSQLPQGRFIEIESNTTDYFNHFLPRLLIYSQVLCDYNMHMRALEYINFISMNKSGLQKVHLDSNQVLMSMLGDLKKRIVANIQLLDEQQQNQKYLSNQNNAIQQQPSQQSQTISQQFDNIAPPLQQQGKQFFSYFNQAIGKISEIAEKSKEQLIQSLQQQKPINVSNQLQNKQKGFYFDKALNTWVIDGVPASETEDLDSNNANTSGHQMQNAVDKQVATNKLQEEEVEVGAPPKAKFNRLNKDALQLETISNEVKVQNVKTVEIEQNVQQHNASGAIFGNPFLIAKEQQQKLSQSQQQQAGSLNTQQQGNPKNKKILRNRYIA